MAECHINLISDDEYELFSLLGAATLVRGYKIMPEDEYIIVNGNKAENVNVIYCSREYQGQYHICIRRHEPPR